MNLDYRRCPCLKGVVCRIWRAPPLRVPSIYTEVGSFDDALGAAALRALAARAWPGPQPPSSAESAPFPSPCQPGPPTAAERPAPHSAGAVSEPRRSNLNPDGATHHRVRRRALAQARRRPVRLSTGRRSWRLNGGPRLCCGIIALSWPASRLRWCSEEPRPWGTAEQGSRDSGFCWRKAKDYPTIQSVTDQLICRFVNVQSALSQMLSDHP
jgi:hypothetical protein